MPKSPDQERPNLSLSATTREGYEGRSEGWRVFEVTPPLDAPYLSDIDEADSEDFKSGSVDSYPLSRISSERPTL